MRRDARSALHDEVGDAVYVRLAIDLLSEGMTMTARAWLVALAMFTVAGCGSDGGETGSATCTGAGVCVQRVRL